MTMYAGYDKTLIPTRARIFFFLCHHIQTGCVLPTVLQQHSAWGCRMLRALPLLLHMYSCHSALTRCLSLSFKYAVQFIQLLQFLEIPYAIECDHNDQFVLPVCV